MPALIFFFSLSISLSFFLFSFLDFHMHLAHFAGTNIQFNLTDNLYALHEFTYLPTKMKYNIHRNLDLIENFFPFSFVNSHY
jgi:hypothetical protein